MVRNKVFPVTISFVFFVFLGAHLWAAPLILGTADTPPLSTLNNDGILDRIVLGAFEAIGVPVEIRHLPSERSLSDAAEGIIDGEYARIAGIAPAYPTLVLVEEKLADVQFCVFSLDPAIAPSTWEDLGGYHIGFIRGWKILEENCGPAKSITTVAKEQALFSLLLAGRVDLIIYDRSRGEYFLRQQGMDHLHIADPPLAVRGMHLYLHRRHAALVPQLAEAVREVRESQ